MGNISAHNYLSYDWIVTSISETYANFTFFDIVITSVILMSAIYLLVALFYNKRRSISNPSQSVNMQTNQGQSQNIPKQTRIIIHSFPHENDESPNTIQIEKDTGKINLLTKHDKVSYKQVKSHVFNGLFETFLPAGYPHSVAKGYSQYALYSNLSTICLVVMNSLSTQSIFVALGSTMNKANVAAAAYAWVLKDGIGQFGGILFASRYGRNFDEDIKKWNFMAIVALNISVYIEILTLKFPSYFLTLSSIANVGKHICFLLTASTRAKINVHFSKSNNIGDISGKSQSQSTAANLLGIVSGVALTKIIDITVISQLYFAFVVLTVINIGATYLSAKIIDEVHLNNQRSFILFNEFFKSQGKNVLNVKDVNNKVIFYAPTLLNYQICNFIKYGQSSIYNVLATSKPQYYTQSVLQQLEKQNRNFIYHIKLLPRLSNNLKFFLNNDRPFEIHLNMNQKATNSDILQSYYFSRLLDIQLQSKAYLNNESINESIRTAEWEFTQVDFNDLEKRLKNQGWSLEYIYLDPKKNRYIADED